MTKEEKIKEAYGENYNPHNIDENGWMKYSLWMHFFKKVDADYDEFDNRNMIVRPNSLTCIENNNGWTKIENEDDLPKEKGLKCIFLCIHGNTTYISDDVLEDPKWFANKYSHWRLKNEIKDPIY